MRNVVLLCFRVFELQFLLPWFFAHVDDDWVDVDIAPRESHILVDNLQDLSNGTTLNTKTLSLSLASSSAYSLNRRDLRCHLHVLPTLIKVFWVFFEMCLIMLWSCQHQRQVVCDF